MDSTAIRRLCEMTLPPPWKAIVEGRDHTSGDSFILIGPAGPQQTDLYLTGESSRVRDEDLDFIAHARGDIPALLDALQSGASHLERRDDLVEVANRAAKASAGPWSVEYSSAGEMLAIGDLLVRLTLVLPDGAVASARAEDVDFVAKCRSIIDLLLHEARERGLLQGEPKAGD
jgi:hypothetical protein